MARALAKQSGSVSISMERGPASRDAFVAEVSDAFKAGGWTVSTSTLSNLGYATPSGLSMIVWDPSNLSKGEQVVATSFRLADVKFGIQRLQSGDQGFGSTIILVVNEK